MLKKKALLSLTIFLMTLAQMALALYLPSLPAIAKGLQISAEAAQSTLTIFLFSYGFCQLFVGPISDLYGRRPLALWGLFFLFVGTLLVLLSTNSFFLFFARFFQGLGAGSLAVLTRSTLRDQFHQEELVKVLAILTICMSVTPTFAPFLGGYLQSWFGWQASFYFLGFLILLGFSLAFLFFSETNRHFLLLQEEERKILRNYRLLLTHRSYRGFVFLIVLSYSSYAIALGMAPFLFQSGLGFSPEQYGNITLLFGLGYLLGTFVSHRFGKPILLTLGVASNFLAGLMLILFSTHNLFLKIFPIMLIFFGLGAVFAYALSMALSPFPKAAGTASGLLGFFQMSGSGMISGMLNFFFTTSFLVLGVSVLCLSFFMMIVLCCQEKENRFF